jgi:outer membrane protein OmpA-like peptidoglycan-associated protein
MPYLKALITALLILISPWAMAADVKGSADHPLITRYPDSEITWYDVQEFQEYKIAVGPVTGYRQVDDWVDVAGKITRINYGLDGTRSYFEVYANYKSALEKAGFAILAEGNAPARKGSDVGSRAFLEVQYAANPVPPGSSNVMTGSATSGGAAYLAARLSRPTGDVYVVLSAAQYREDRIETLVDIIEARPMEDDLVFVDAEAMSKDIQSFGKVVLYGIHFEHDKAAIMAESLPVVAEIAKLLQAHPDLKVYVVGHTDGTGKLDYNLKLSKDRAASVVTTLVKEHAIAAGRLDAHGVGPLVPVAANGEDAGKAKNRRVELVER